LERPQIAVEDLVPLIPPTAYRAVTVRDKTYWTFTLAVRLPGLGKVRLVVSFKSAELTGTYVVLVTNRVDWDAQRIITLYLQRWPIETFYQDGKTHLGLDEYRMRHAEAIGKHWCLVFVAYSLLHLDCLPPSLMQGSLPIKTIGEACRQHAQALLQALSLYAHEQLQRGQQAADLFAALFAKQQPVLVQCVFISIYPNHNTRVRYPLSHPWQLDRPQLGLGEYHLAELHVVPGCPPHGAC
jgi:hypothetical protein